MSSNSFSDSSNFAANNDTKNPKADTKKKANLRDVAGLFSYVWPYRGIFFLGMVFLALSTSTVLLFPYLASMLADSALGKAPLTVYQIGWLLVILLALQGIFSFWRIWLFARVSEQAMSDIRQALYARLVALPISFFEHRRVGELTSRISSDVTQLQGTLANGLAELFRQAATIIAGIFVIAFTSIKLTLIMLSTLPLAIIVAIFWGKRIRNLARTTQDKLAETNTIVEETLQAIQTVKSFANEWFEVGRYRKTMVQTVDAALYEARFRGGFVSFLITAVFGGIVLVLWVGASMVQAGSLDIGELLRFILYTMFIGGSIAGTSALYGEFQKAIGASERIKEILTRPAEDVDIAQAAVRPSLKGQVIYKDISFEYPGRPDVAVLKQVNLHIEPGQKIALVGASGAGKSTIVQLLMRFYEPTNGQITINNQPLNEFNVGSLRANIGLVPQEVLLFGGTIAQNILYGKPNATESELIEATKKANAYEFIQLLPDGFNTIVGERGIKLSGGQRQRIAIARAILKNPDILILDEATSSLDAESEHLVQQALTQLMQHRTTIIIAHRLATIRHTDRIYVLEKGHIVEEGSHNDLIAKNNGVYQNLLKLQTDAYGNLQENYLQTNPENLLIA